MRFAWVAMAVVVGCSFNEVKTKTDNTPAPPVVLNGEAISAMVAPPAISGGTLYVTRGLSVLASNPDRGTVDVHAPTAYGSPAPWAAQFDANAEPGRLVEGEPGTVYVVLRRAGAIGTIDLATKQWSTREVCPAPRGIAYRADTKTLHVVCAGGEYVTLPQGGEKKTWNLDRDLRDIILDPQGGAWISRFRSAELLHVDAQGNVTSRAKPSVAPDRAIDQETQARYEPNTAWRIAMASDGTIYMLHQMSTTRLVATKSIPVEPPKTDQPPQQQPTSSPYGGSMTAPPNPSMPFCDDQQLVTVAVTRFASTGPTGTDRLTVSAPAVDMALGPGDQIFVAHLNGQVFSHFPSFDGVEPVCVASKASTFTGPVVAVAMENGTPLAQVRDGSAAFASRSLSQVTTPGVRDSGHTIFHMQTAGGIACASCHPEGGDDGHTWNFVDIGLRRTQSLRGGILATAPFHWNGDMHDISMLAHDVFTQRMGGGSLREEQIAVLGSWIDRQPSLPAPSWIEPSAKERGAALFASAGCQKCHSGAHETSNASEDVGTGATFQVPSLVNVGARAPFMHDGCAPTLMARLVDPKCGGSKHGDVANLSASQKSDLVAFLESL